MTAEAVQEWVDKEKGRKMVVLIIMIVKICSVDSLARPKYINGFGSEYFLPCNRSSKSSNISTLFFKEIRKSR